MSTLAEGYELSDEQVRHYRAVLVTHATDLETKVCAVCGVRRCQEWLDAFDKLAHAQQLMVVPEQWASTVRSRRRL
jgi:hypothetical protein